MMKKLTSMWPLAQLNHVHHNNITTKTSGLLLKEKAWRTFHARRHFVINPIKLNPNSKPKP